MIERIEAFQFSISILECEASAQIGEGLTWRVRGGHFWQLVSLATETTGGLILVVFWPKHGLRSDFRVPNLKKFSLGGACPQTPLACSHRNGHTTLK